MAAIIGAIRGVSRGLALLALAILIPALAWVTASLLESVFGLGFWSVFVGLIVLLSFLGVCALFGIANEVQEQHAEAVDRASPGGEV